MGADEDFGAETGDLRGEGSIARDEERALDGAAERIVCAERHGLGGLADPGQPHGSRGVLGPRERLAHTAPPLDAPQARLEEGEQQRAARVAAVRELRCRGRL